mgnify:FL=1|jgi:hypothetical protein|tara:strand:- start:2676 stop:2855 length:180 start_codon:yes stop_codon:yes gene_type:complete
MADKQGMVYKFFQKWKEKRLNKFAKDMLKDNPSLEKDLRQMDNNMQQLLAKLKKQGSRR